MENLWSVSISVLHFSIVGIIPCTIKLVKEKTQKCALNVEEITVFLYRQKYLYNCSVISSALYKLKYYNLSHTISFYILLKLT